jgi:hypothetical protein
MAATRGCRIGGSPDPAFGWVLIPGRLDRRRPESAIPAATSVEARDVTLPDLDIEETSADSIRLMPMSSAFAGRPDPPYGAGR